MMKLAILVVATLFVVGCYPGDDLPRRREKTASAILLKLGYEYIAPAPVHVCGEERWTERSIVACDGEVKTVVMCCDDKHKMTCSGLYSRALQGYEKVPECKLVNLRRTAPEE